MYVLFELVVLLDELRQLGVAPLLFVLVIVSFLHDPTPSKVRGTVGTRGAQS